MSQHNDPTKFTVREREIQVLEQHEKENRRNTRVRQIATIFDFTAIKNLLGKAMRTCFICAINKKAVLESVFRKLKEKLTFSKTVDIATEVEEAAITAKAQVYSKSEVHKIQTKTQHNYHQKSSLTSKQLSSTQTQCYCYGKKDHMQ